MTQAEQDYYVKSLARRSFHSGLNWYKIRRINYEDELALVGKVITHPCLMVSADKDFALPPALTAHMPQVLPNLKMVVVQNASHWVNTEDPDAVNKALKTFLGFN
ncbi:alpha/beta-hydrolase [Ramicandelaber brevisporus]|nr:alpha/beta-hydrolase [Ramicandelaber brevisporus]